MPDASEPTDRYFKIAALRKLLTFDKGGKGSSFDLNTSASMNSNALKAAWVLSGFIILVLAAALYNISFAHGERGPDIAKIDGSLQDRRLVSGFAPQRVYQPSAESMAPDSVLPAPPNSHVSNGFIDIVAKIFVFGCLGAFASNRLVFFGCCSRNRAAALASVVPSPSEGAPSGQPQQEAFTEVPDAL